jgi:ADP-ribose pyrophosphatase
MDLTETRISSETLVKGKLLHAKRDKVRLPNGHETEREYVEHPGAVLVIPLLDDGQLVMERQFRYPLHRTFIELPAGKIDAGEDPLQTGKRELLEETGYSANQWQFLTSLYPCIGYSNEIIHVYLARDLALGKPHADEDELLDIFTMSLSQALEAMRRGEINDGKTMIALFWAEKHLAGNWPASDATVTGGNK